jgi:mediator of RNA polymerase II transcription subunit 18
MRSGLKGIDAGFLHRLQPPQRQELWRGLHEQLVRQSYIITLLYDIDRAQLGQGGKDVVDDGEDGALEDKP